MARPGFTEDGKRIQPVANYNPVTGEYEAGGGGGGSISAEATAAPPSYEEGASAPLSMDLDGNLRIGGVISAETAVTATAAAPTYVEASAANPLSTNLSGDLRVIAKQSGTWTVSLPTGAATAAAQTAVTGSKAAGTAAASSILTGGVFNTSLPTLTNGQQAAAQMDASGRIYTTATVTTLPALVAGSAIVGKVGIDQTTPGTTNAVVMKTSAGTEISFADPTTGTGSQVASSASAVTILAANTSRKGATIFNDSTQVLYLILSNTTPTSAVYTVKMAAGSYYEVPAGYNGIIKGIWASANGNAVITELT